MFVYRHNGHVIFNSSGWPPYSTVRNTGFNVITGNPKIINDRIILDSNFNMVSRIANNENGYTYYCKLSQKYRGQ